MEAVLSIQTLHVLPVPRVRSLERLESLGYRYPTPLQSEALRTQRDAILRAPTDAGGRVAYLVRCLAKAAKGLEARGEVTAQVICRQSHQCS